MTPVRFTLINGFSKVSDEAVKAYMHAQSIQFARDVTPIWGMCPALEFKPGGKGASEGSSPCWLSDTLDVAGALGYHDEDSFGIPYIKVGNLPGYDWRTTASHEFLEVKGDSPANIWAQGPGNTMVAYELGDPVQGDTYLIEKQPMSNFVFPAWFDPQAAPGERLDYLGKLAKPLTMTPNGYMIVWHLTGQATQQFGAHVQKVSDSLFIHFGEDVSKERRDTLTAKYWTTGRRAPTG